MFHRVDALWSNGKTADSGSVYRGSSPCRAAIFTFSLPQPAYTASKKKLTRRNKALTLKKQEAQKIQKELEQKKKRSLSGVKKIWQLTNGHGPLNSGMIFPRVPRERF